MKREFLQNLGLEKDQIDTIMSEHGKSVADVNARLKSAQESQEALQAQLAGAFVPRPGRILCVSPNLVAYRIVTETENIGNRP